MNERGLFITFEGVEGAGKTTQVEMLRTHFAQSNLPHLFTREPGGTPAGDKLRSILVDGATHIGRETEALVVAAARAELVDKVIGPALTAGTHVVCDRYADSTYAYQGYGRGLPLGLLVSVSSFAARGLVPDITFLLDVDVTVSHGRVAARGAADRMEREPRSFHQLVRDGYLALAKADPKRFHVLDGTRPAVAIFSDIERVIAGRLNARVAHGRGAA